MPVIEKEDMDKGWAEMIHGFLPGSAITNSILKVI